MFRFCKTYVLTYLISFLSSRTWDRSFLCSFNRFFYPVTIFGLNISGLQTSVFEIFTSSSFRNNVSKLKANVSKKLTDVGNGLLKLSETISCFIGSRRNFIVLQWILVKNEKRRSEYMKFIVITTVLVTNTGNSCCTYTIQEKCTWFCHSKVMLLNSFKHTRVIATFCNVDIMFFIYSMWIR